MEKSAAKNKKFIFGLLVSFILLGICAEPAFAKKYPTYEYVRSLSFKKVDDYFFTAEDCSYILDIANVTPENVTVYVNTLPAHVSFISSKKEILVPEPGSDDENGTRIIMKLSFSQPGSYKVNAIDVIVNGIYYRIPFERVEVLNNPRQLVPELSVKFEDGHVLSNKGVITARSGDHIRFTLYSKYAVSIENISWKVPENSLFQEVKSFEFITEAVDKKTFTPNEVPLITYDWQPLKSATYSFPEISIVALSYNGSRSELVLPNITFRILDARTEAKVAEDSYSSVYAYAFDEPAEEENHVFICDDAALRKIRALREKERRSVPYFTDAKKERTAYEEYCGLDNVDDEASIPLGIVSWVIFVLLMVSSVVVFLLKRKIEGVVVSVAALFFLIHSVFYTVSISERHGVFKGGLLSPIPEENISTAVELSAGCVVSIKERAGNWLYVRHNESYGWIPKDSVYIIR
ncbi:hypothetical protein [Treponema sp.]|uniref:hypothetical protein n=1 Tax=Treponema sp. TaxID=166 RepID=UPI00258010D5|nr:hypothetical protein [Treponema sp.]MBE6354210.1 hypothetical protein [Treponema sp.]